MKYTSIPKFSNKRSSITFIEGALLERGRVRNNYSKEKGRALLIISFLLSDGKKHKQKEIKKLFNSLHDEVMWKQGESSIFEEMGWIWEILDGFDYSGHVTDQDVSRVVQTLEKKCIVKREAIKVGRGTRPIFNSLQKHPLAFLNILTLLNSFKGLSDGESVFLGIGKYLISSEYGKEVINKESIEHMLEVIPGTFEDHEKQIIFEMTRSSPSALLTLLDLFREFKGGSTKFHGSDYYDCYKEKAIRNGATEKEFLQYVRENEDKLCWWVFNNQKHEKLDDIDNWIHDKLVKDMVFSMGKDVNRPEFFIESPIQYSIEVNFNPNRPNYEEEGYKVNVDKDNVKIQINTLQSRLL